MVMEVLKRVTAMALQVMHTGIIRNTVETKSVIATVLQRKLNAKVTTASAKNQRRLVILATSIQKCACQRHVTVLIPSYLARTSATIQRRNATFHTMSALTIQLETMSTSTDTDTIQRRATTSKSTSTALKSARTWISIATTRRTVSTCTSAIK